MYSCCNCHCFDKTNCLKKGNGYGVNIVEIGKRIVETFVIEVPAAETEGKCKCGGICSCTNCICGH